MNIPESFVEFWEEHIRSKNFTPREILTLGSNRTGLNNFPPPSMWQNIVPTIKVLDKLRKELGEPLKIVSCYRSPLYNQSIGGAPKSYHVQFRATDVSGPAPRRIFAAALALRSAGIFKGGLGLYRGFVHIDTRGQNATW